MAPWWAQAGTEVLFTPAERRFNFLGEQFWGRAARASADSKESGRLLIFRGFLFHHQNILRITPAADLLPALVALNAKINHARRSTAILAHEFSLAQDVILH